MPVDTTPSKFKTPLKIRLGLGSPRKSSTPLLGDVGSPKKSSLRGSPKPKVPDLFTDHSSDESSVCSLTGNITERDPWLKDQSKAARPAHSISDRDTDEDIHNIAANISSNSDRKETKKAKNMKRKKSAGRASGSDQEDAVSPPKRRRSSRLSDDLTMTTLTSGTIEPEPSRGSSSSSKASDSHNTSTVSDVADQDDHVFAEDLEDEDVELFLCQIPSQMDVAMLHSKLLNHNEPLESDTASSKGIQRTLEINVTRHSRPEVGANLSVMCRSREDGSIRTVKKSIEGSILVSEGMEPLPYIMPPIPPKVKRELPPGLKQRHFPFGSGMDSPKLQVPVHQAPDKKRKKKKKTKEKSFT